MPVKISELTAATSLDGDELVPVVQDGVTKYATASMLGANGPCCAVDESGGSPMFVISSGFASVSKNSAGNFTLTLSEAYTLGTILPVVALSGGTAGMCAIEVASTTTFTVRTWNSSAVATDLDFHVMCTVL